MHNLFIIFEPPPCFFFFLDHSIFPENTGKFEVLSSRSEKQEVLGSRINVPEFDINTSNASER